VEFHLPLSADDYQSYRAALLTDKGVEKFGADNLQARTEAGNKAVSLRVPAAILTQGDYRIILRSPTSELQEVDGYTFRVAWKLISAPGGGDSAHGWCGEQPHA
jgi:hypothetical protein